MRKLAFALVLSLPLAAFGYDRGEQVLSYCGANPSSGLEEAMNSLHCSGYLTGIVDGVLMMQGAGPDQKQYICPPIAISGEQTLKAVTRWLQQNPAAANESARVSVLEALVATYPCPQR